MQNLLNLEVMKLISDLKGLCALYDDVETQVRSLDNVGLQPIYQGPMLVPVLMNKLSEEIKTVISREFNENVQKLHPNAIQDLKVTYHIQLFIVLLVGKSFKKTLKEKIKGENHSATRCNNVTDPKKKRKQIIIKDKPSFVCLFSGQIAKTCRKNYKLFN